MMYAERVRRSCRFLKNAIPSIFSPRIFGVDAQTRIKSLRQTPRCGNAHVLFLRREFPEYSLNARPSNVQRPTLNYSVLSNYELTSMGHVDL